MIFEQPFLGVPIRFTPPRCSRASEARTHKISTLRGWRPSQLDDSTIKQEAMLTCQIKSLMFLKVAVDFLLVPRQTTTFASSFSMIGFVFTTLGHCAWIALISSQLYMFKTHLTDLSAPLFLGAMYFFGWRLGFEPSPFVFRQM